MFNIEASFNEIVEPQCDVSILSIYLLNDSINIHSALQVPIC